MGWVILNRNLKKSSTHKSTRVTRVIYCKIVVFEKTAQTTS